MKNMRLHLLALSCMAALAVAAQPVLAGNGNSASGSVNAGSAIASHLVTRYASFAGSQSNAGALVAGLRTGTPIVLTGSGSGSGGSATQTTITPATRAMGYGEVNTALALAQAELVKYGISNPSPQQIQAALNGGTVTTANGVAALSGVLAMRQSGQGWGRIANHLGYNLGSVLGAQNHAGVMASAGAATTESARLASRYLSFAGSQSNAGALVAGLRTGTPIVLTGSGSGGSATQTTITPATRAMGYGEVNTALALAQAELVKYGISNPSPQQIQAALNGGTVTTANGVETLSGVLAMRQSGQGWGQIANHLGYNLGSLVSAAETGNSQAGMHGSVAAGLDVGGHGHGAGASADAAANASMRARVGVPANLPQRPNLPAVVRPNLPIHIGVGVGGGI